MPFSLVWFLNVFLMQHYISVVSEERTTMHIYDPCASFFLSFVAARLEKYASFRLFIFTLEELKPSDKHSFFGFS